MKFGARKFSWKKSLSALTSTKRIVRNALGIRAPRGFGWLTNPKKTAYNRVYSRTTFSWPKLIGSILSMLFSSEKKGRRK